MICFKSWGLFAGVMVTGLLPAALAEAQVRSREIVPQRREGHFPEGRGCYWANGRGSCRAYCYIEADGRRFCTERSFNAEPQAPYAGGRPQGLLLK